MRYFPAFIVGFWLLMMVLLIRLQIHPEGSDVLSVPPTHILELMFTHGQGSDLSVYNNSDRRIGSISLRPSRLKEAGERKLEFSGNVQLNLPGVAGQRLFWETHTRLDDRFSVVGAEVRLTMREPEYRLMVKINPANRIANYTLSRGSETVDSSSVELTEKGLEKLLVKLGIDPAGLKALRAGAEPPDVSATRTKFAVRGEKIEAYRVTVRQNEQKVAEAYVSQLGQVLLLKTSLGFRFVQDDFLP